MGEISPHANFVLILLKNVITDNTNFMNIYSHCISSDNIIIKQINSPINY